MFLNLILVSNSMAAFMTDNSATIEEELRIFSRTIYEFSFDKRIDTPEQQLALFNTAPMILEFFAEEGEDFVFEAIDKIFGDRKKFATHFSSSPMYILFFFALDPFHKDNKEIAQCLKKVWQLIEREMEQNETIIKPIRKEIFAVCRHAANDALKIALSNGITPEDAVNVSHQAVMIILLKYLNKYAGPILETLYKAHFSAPYPELPTNPFRSPESWDTICKTYFCQLTPEALMYLNPWKVSLYALVFRKQASMFLLGHRDGGSEVATLPQDVVRNIIGHWIFRAQKTHEAA